MCISCHIQVPPSTYLCSVACGKGVEVNIAIYLGSGYLSLPTILATLAAHMVQTERNPRLEGLATRPLSFISKT